MTCKKCGTAVEDGKKFCPTCGNPMAAPEAAAPTPEPTPAPTPAPAPEPTTKQPVSSPWNGQIFQKQLMP